MTDTRLAISRKWIRVFTELFALAYFRSHPNSSGYDLSKYVKEIYGYRISCSKIYPLLDRMQESEVISMRKDASDYPPKKRYRLTPKGRRMLREYRDVFMRFVEGL